MEHHGAELTTCQTATVLFLLIHVINLLNEKVAIALVCSM